VRPTFGGFPTERSLPHASARSHPGGGYTLDALPKPAFLRYAEGAHHGSGGGSHEQKEELCCQSPLLGDTIRGLFMGILLDPFVRGSIFFRVRSLLRRIGRFMPNSDFRVLTQPSVQDRRSCFCFETVDRFHFLDFGDSFPCPCT